MDSNAIELRVRRLHEEIWEHKKTLFPLGVPHAVQMCDPRVAAEVLGLEYVEVDGLGRFGNGKERFETAGALDRPGRLIAVSTSFEYLVRRFTGAHEVGHFDLHPGTVLHRDRPIFEMAMERAPIEREADYFAACFLAPPNLVRREFAMRFGTKVPLPLTDTVAFYLQRNSSRILLNSSPSSLEFARAVAAARSFGAAPFQPLNVHFGLSVSAMAIRLRELKLVVD